MNGTPRCAQTVSSLPVGAIGYMVITEDGPVGLLSSAYGTETVIQAADDMNRALRAAAPPPGPRTRANIRKVS